MSGGYTALLAVSQATYDDIYTRLEKLGYGHCFNNSPIHGPTINMSEISLAVDRTEKKDERGVFVHLERLPNETREDYVERMKHMMADAASILAKMKENTNEQG